MRFLSLLLCFTCTLTATAQISEGMATYDDKTLTSLRMTIDAPADEVEERWEEFWEDRYDIDIDKLDKDRNSMAYKAEQVRLALVSNKNLDLYSKVTDVDNRSDIAVAFAYTDSDVISRGAYPDSYRAAESILTEFRTTFYQQYFDERIADVRKDLEDVRDDSRDDTEDAEKARRKIDKYKDKIAKYERRIEDLRDEVGDELESSEEMATRATELERKLRDLEQQRARYLQ